MFVLTHGTASPSGPSGRLYRGLGGLSGGGATSNLLRSYPTQARGEVLDLLFKPGYAASLDILKVEIGSDDETTNGCEASHMRTPTEVACDRGYEWGLMLHAKARNPNIELYALPWNFPGWLGVGSPGCNPDPRTNFVGHGDGDTAPCDIFFNRSRTANYIVEWVQCASTRTLSIDWVGVHNEAAWDPEYIMILRQALDERGFHTTKITAPDGDIGPVAAYLTRNATVRAAVASLSSHYPGINGHRSASGNASNLGMPLAASEDYSTYSDSNGAGCWARTLVLNARNNFTSTISWYLVAATSVGIGYDGDGFVRAEWPSSGHFEATPMLWMTFHWYSARCCCTAALCVVLLHVLRLYVLVSSRQIVSSVNLCTCTCTSVSTDLLHPHARTHARTHAYVPHRRAPSCVSGFTTCRSLFVTAADNARFTNSGLLSKGGSYVVLTSAAHTTVIIEALHWNSSQCIRSNPPYYPVQRTQAVDLDLTRSLGTGAGAGVELAVWRSCIDWRYSSGTASSYLQQQGNVQVVNSRVQLEVDANCVYTLSSKLTVTRPTLPDATAHAQRHVELTLPHTDNFSGTVTNGGAPLFFSDVLGKFEITEEGWGEAAAGPRGGSGPTRALAQVVTEYLPISNNCPAHWYPTSLLGSMDMADLEIGVDISLPTVAQAGAAQPNGAFLGLRLRQWHGDNADGAFRTQLPGLFLWLEHTRWRLCADNKCSVELRSGAAQPGSRWRGLRLSLTGRLASGWLQGTPIFQDVQIPPPNATAAHVAGSLVFPRGHVSDTGWPAIGSTFTAVRFSNFHLRGNHGNGTLASPGCSSAGSDGHRVGAFPLSRLGTRAVWRVDKVSNLVYTEPTSGSDRLALPAARLWLCSTGTGDSFNSSLKQIVVSSTCPSHQRLRYDPSTGRMRGTGDPTMCVDVRAAYTYTAPATSTTSSMVHVRAAGAVTTTCTPEQDQPSESQQFQYDHAMGTLRFKKGSCLTRGYFYSTVDDTDNFRSCGLGFCY